MEQASYPILNIRWNGGISLSLRFHFVGSLRSRTIMPSTENVTSAKSWNATVRKVGTQMVDAG
jgi:hypothetical protein